MNANLLKYLRGRKIAPILEKSHEKNDEIALQKMRIIDFELENFNYYARMNGQTQQSSGTTKSNQSSSHDLTRPNCEG